MIMVFVKYQSRLHWKRVLIVNLVKAKTTAIPASKFYCATEEGDLVIADWMADKATEEKGQSSKVEVSFSKHFGTMSDLRRSPFFPDILLSVGGWTFNIWKEGHNVFMFNSGWNSIRFCS